MRDDGESPVRLPGIVPPDVCPVHGREGDVTQRSDALWHAFEYWKTYLWPSIADLMQWHCFQVAANAVLAGCMPEMFPVVLAAVEVLPCLQISCRMRCCHITTIARVAVD